MVHAGDVFVRGLLYDTTVLRVDISRSDVDRTEVPPSPTTDDGPWHPPVPKHSKDIEFHSSRPTCIDLHLRLVNSCWHHSFGKISATHLAQGGHWKVEVFEKVTTCSFSVFLYFLSLVGYMEKNTLIVFPNKVIENVENMFVKVIFVLCRFYSLSVITLYIPEYNISFRSIFVSRISFEQSLIQNWLIMFSANDINMTCVHTWNNYHRFYEEITDKNSMDIIGV